MNSVTGIVHAGKIELPKSVDWPEGTRVEVRPLETHSQTGDQPASEGGHATVWPADFFAQLRAEWGPEPFERPSQGNLESREDW